MSLWSAIGSIFGGKHGGDPYEAYRNQLGQIPGMLQKEYGPYQQAGQQDLGSLQAQFGNMINDPQGLIDRLVGKFNYQESPGYKFQVDQATGAANRAAAAGGMLGSPAEQASLASTVQGLAAQDYGNQYQRYMEMLSKVLGMYGSGMQGMGGIEQQGYDATQNIASGLGSYYGAQAKAAEEDAKRKNQEGSGLGGLIGSGIKSIFGGL